MEPNSAYETPLRRTEPVSPTASGSRLRNLFHNNQLNSETPIKRNRFLNLSPLKKRDRGLFKVLSPTKASSEQQENYKPLQDNELESTIDFTGELSSLLTSDDSQNLTRNSTIIGRRREEERIRASQREHGYFTEEIPNLSHSSSLLALRSVIELVGSSQDDFTIYTDDYPSNEDGDAEDETSSVAEQQQQPESLRPLQVGDPPFRSSSSYQFRKVTPGTQHYLLTREESVLFKSRKYGPVTPKKVYLKNHEAKRNFSSGESQKNLLKSESVAPDSSTFQQEEGNESGDLEKFYYRRAWTGHSCPRSTALFFVFASFVVPPFWLLICVGYLDKTFGRVPLEYKVASGVLALTALAGCAIGIGLGFYYSVN
ncbi:hypothetical protein KL933_002005 [Ogataea haglerorum]|uniref:Uncharacterized protein n=1 Tax=Ogataea haglerorum TaxID=1937702 RepID=A0AAN6I1A6_9ASCO|nr:hypothetical protein KL915_001148 [Ogataea haglerorum]KAG7711322.1 hypothetical protein KL950_001288 [Ogataea haglerorum]KAG7720619.1 hypothetical protein KL913_001519 [Ogataea haglerorum]KAG7721005.1 hypothetical protein KL949_001877 [Ogataea haglerorum]KAG7728772.1 hypothetical protein KL933_002005 [Ogataea haglerorum]